MKMMWSRVFCGANVMQMFLGADVDDVEDSRGFPVSPPECSLLNKAPPTPTMYKYRPSYSPGKNHTALTHAYANQVTAAAPSAALTLSSTTSLYPV